MILDKLELDKLYTELELDLSYEDIRKMKEEETFKVLGIDFERRKEKLDSIEEQKTMMWHLLWLPSVELMKPERLWKPLI